MQEKINLIQICPSFTHNSASLIWDRPADIINIMAYHIYVNDMLLDKTYKTDYTIENLEANTKYTAYVVVLMRNGDELKSNKIEIHTKDKGNIINIIDFGAVSSETYNNTKNIQDAIDSTKPNDIVYFPKGVFVSGAIFLKSDLTLYLEDGAKLLGIDNIVDYPIMTYRFEGVETSCHASLINTKKTDSRHKNITIMGKGTIDANGSVLLKKELAENKGIRGRAVCIRNTDNLYIKDVTIRQSPAWCLHTIYCNNVVLNGVQIHTKYDENGKRYKGIYNGDGFDPDSCKNVYVFNSMISSQDDCIAIKSGKDKEGRDIDISTENVRITNCQFRSGFGIVIGSEMSGNVRNVFVQDCDFANVYSVVSLKAPRGRGGVIENIVYDNIKHFNHSNEMVDCKWFRGAIYIDQFYGHDTFDDETALGITEETSIIQNIEFRNFAVDTIAGNAIYFNGLPESPIKNITLKNIRAKGLHGMFINNTKNLKLENVNILV